MSLLRNKRIGKLNYLDSRYSLYRWRVYCRFIGNYYLLLSMYFDLGVLSHGVVVSTCWFIGKLLFAIVYDVVLCVFYGVAAISAGVNGVLLSVVVTSFLSLAIFYRCRCIFMLVKFTRCLLICISLEWIFLQLSQINYIS